MSTGNEDLLEELRGVFGGNSLTTIGQTPTSIVPSKISKELATEAIQNFDLSPVLRDIGIIVAREIANELESMALRPADYVRLPDMPQMVAARIASELASAPQEFLLAFVEQLKLRG